MNDKMYTEIEGVLSGVKGDIIDFRVYKGTSFAHLVKLGTKANRTVIGMDTFYGLEAPTSHDWNEDRYMIYPKGYVKSTPDLVREAVTRVNGNAPYELLEGSLDTILPNLPERSYAVAFVDMLQYEPTVKVLNYIYKRMTPGGIIYLLNYNKQARHNASLAVTEFLEQYAYDIEEYPPEIHNDNRANFTRFTCKQTDESQKREPIVQKTPKRKSTDPKINIALVLRTGGGTYDAKYVNAVARNIANNVTVPYTLNVLTDNDKGFDPEFVHKVIPFKHNFKGWWSKIELFRPGIFKGDRVFYLDLDTVVVGNIDDMVTWDVTFAGIRDLYHHTFMQTGLLSWNPQYNHQIYENFLAVSAKVMNEYPEGDARWIRENVYNYDYLPDEFPNRIVSYKAHCLNKDTGKVAIPPRASIICFHGKPRPHTITNPLITAHWTYK